MKIYYTNVGLKRLYIKRTFETALKYLGQPSDAMEMSLSVVSEQEIKELNKEFRQVDSVTDVLSFPTVDLQRKVIDVDSFDCDSINVSTGRINIGDVIICLERAKEQALNYGHSIKREMSFLALHGLLHLLGYDHVENDDEEQMTNLQKEILVKVNINR